jgi:hypothetical protein
VPNVIWLEKIAESKDILRKLVLAKLKVRHRYFKLK